MLAAGSSWVMWPGERRDIGTWAPVICTVPGAVSAWVVWAPCRFPHLLGVFVFWGATHSGAAGGLNAAAAHLRVVLPRCDVGLVGFGGVRSHRPVHA